VNPYKTERMALRTFSLVAGGASVLTLLSKSSHGEPFSACTAWTRWVTVSVRFFCYPINLFQHYPRERAWLKMQRAEEGETLPGSLSRIPVQVIRRADLNETLELKILAEANFIPDLKVPWPLDAQARAVEEYYQQFCKAKRADHETALAEVVSVFGISRQRAIDLLEALESAAASPAVVPAINPRTIIAKIRITAILPASANPSLNSSAAK
jgi:hypothetical protein